MFIMFRLFSRIKHTKDKISDEHLENTLIVLPLSNQILINCYLKNKLFSLKIFIHFFSRYKYIFLINVLLRYKSCL